MWLIGDYGMSDFFVWYKYKVLSSRQPTGLIYTEGFAPGYERFA